MDREGSSQGRKSLGKTPDLEGISSLPGVTVVLWDESWAKAALLRHCPDDADNCSPPHSVVSRVEFGRDMKPGFQRQD